MKKVVALLTLTVTASATPPIPDIETLEGLILVNQAPRLIPWKLAFLCSEVTPEITEQMEQEYGPHGSAHVRNYVTPDIYSQLSNEEEISPDYISGSIIVKEKLSWIDGELKTSGIGGMVKLDDPEYVDTNGWQFFYLENNRITRGKIQSCVECHQKSPSKDFVFGDYTQYYRKAQITIKDSQ